MPNKLLLTACFIFCAQTAFSSTDVTRFTSGNLDHWETKSFVGETDYQLTEYNHQTALQAKSDASASGLIFKKKIDLQETPYLNWSWLIENHLDGLDEASKSGDDYVARIYVVMDGGFSFWKTKALTYVWSSNQQQGTVWDNAFAGDAVKMVAVRGQQDSLDTWYNEKRNVYEDLIEYFGDRGSDKANLKKYRYIDATVIMTDTDNAGGAATSYYGEISFTEN